MTIPQSFISEIIQIGVKQVLQWDWLCLSYQWHREYGVPKALEIGANFLVTLQMLGIASGILKMISYTEKISITSKTEFFLTRMTLLRPWTRLRKQDCQSIICHDQHISHERGLGTRKEALPVFFFLNFFLFNSLFQIKSVTIKEDVFAS